MKLQQKFTTYFKSVVFMAGMALSSTAFAGLINADFSNDLNGWEGDVFIYEYATDSTFEEYNVNVGDYTANFATAGNSVTLTTSADQDNEYYGIYLFQQFEVAANSAVLSLEYSTFLTEPLDDLFQVSLVDQNFDLLHDFTIDGLSTDISAYAGSEIALYFGVLDGDFSLGDSLTVSNISISSVPVPEPTTFAIFALGLAGLSVRKKLSAA
ncbi:hypothetical protein DS2_12063 [Catenovulum agarivorans DS-2]|uniref:Ice-binding protein C-terminal domain-containing protein n=1 Tax=Catenovulum agarivorans DS-2 TaxID=1328313 RepID=W7QCD7_9ALTE|nr:PEP-CTERM sorting domain-containing protein [Catenovulum agarivorans]EWH09566.1 hypothetical protein DS2_12063 [Catenovulum agarivorans DS-2]